MKIKRIGAEKFCDEIEVSFAPRNRTCDSHQNVRPEFESASRYCQNAQLLMDFSLWIPPLPLRVHDIIRKYAR